MAEESLRKLVSSGPSPAGLRQGSSWKPARITKYNWGNKKGWKKSVLPSTAVARAQHPDVISEWSLRNTWHEL